LSIILTSEINNRQFQQNNIDDWKKENLLIGLKVVDHLLIFFAMKP